MRTVGFKIVPVLDFKLVGWVETHFDGSKTQNTETIYDMNSITHHTITITMRDMLTTPKFYWQCIISFLWSILYGLIFFIIVFIISQLLKLDIDNIRIFGIELIFYSWFFAIGISIIFFGNVILPDWFADYKIDSFVQKNKFNNPNRWKVVKDKDWIAFTAKLKYVPKN